MILSKEKVLAISFISLCLLQFVKGQIGQITWDTSYSAYNQFVVAKTIIDQDSTFGVQIEYYPNGNIQYLINRKDGELHGHYIYFNDDGSLRSYKFYRHGEALTYQIYHKKSFEVFEVLKLSLSFVSFIIKEVCIKLVCILFMFLGFLPHIVVNDFYQVQL